MSVFLDEQRGHAAAVRALSPNRGEGEKDSMGVSQVAAEKKPCRIEDCPEPRQKPRTLCRAHWNQRRLELLANESPERREARLINARASAKRRRHTPAGKAERKRYRDTHRDVMNAANRRWRERHRDELNARR
jgi:hypothetical protein